MTARIGRRAGIRVRLPGVLMDRAVTSLSVSVALDGLGTDNFQLVTATNLLGDRPLANATIAR